MCFIHVLSVSFLMFCWSFILDCLVQIMCNNFEFKRQRKNNKDLSKSVCEYNRLPGNNFFGKALHNLKKQNTTDPRNRILEVAPRTFAGTLFFSFLVLYLKIHLCPNKFYIEMSSQKRRREKLPSWDVNGCFPSSSKEARDQRQPRGTAPFSTNDELKNPSFPR